MVADLESFMFPSFDGLSMEPREAKARPPRYYATSKGAGVNLPNRHAPDQISYGASENRSGLD